MHGLYRYVGEELGIDNINFMTGETHYTSNSNPIYDLKRVDV